LIQYLCIPKRALEYGEQGQSQFTQVMRLAREMNLVRLGAIAVDGTKIKACANRHKDMSYGRMQTTEMELKAQIETLVQRASSTDEAENDEPELDIPAEIDPRQARLQAIAAAKARLEERQRQRQRRPTRSRQALPARLWCNCA
jgi:hypothetical protein